MKKILASITAVLLLLVAVPGFAARGSADFTRFVALGDSYGAGVESGSLNQNHQPFNWPAIIARQAGAPDFQQPLVSFPGIGPELQLVNLSPTLAPAAGQGSPINLALPRAYNNLSIPGANVTDLTTITGADNPPRNTAQTFAQFILRGKGTAVDQALSQNPTFIAIWIGGNDLLGAVLSGTPKALTPVETFRTSYNAMLDRLVAGAPSAGMVVGNLPTSPTVPVLNTVPPILVRPDNRQPVLDQNGNPIFLVSDLGNGTIGQLPPGSKVLLTALSKIQTGVGIPATLKTIPPFNLLPNVGTPLADSDTLTPSEQAEIVARAAVFNDVITQAATARNIPVADIRGLFDRVDKGLTIGPFTFNGSFITGGIFSLDGFHMTDIGYTLFANEYIKAINSAYDTEIPLASIAEFFTNNGAFFPETLGTAELQELRITPAAEQQMLMMANPSGPRRLRAAAHGEECESCPTDGSGPRSQQ